MSAWSFDRDDGTPRVTRVQRAVVVQLKARLALAQDMLDSIETKADLAQIAINTLDNSVDQLQSNLALGQAAIQQLRNRATALEATAASLQQQIDQIKTPVPIGP